jgi:hypothetical protein
MQQVVVVATLSSYNVHRARSFTKDAKSLTVVAREFQLISQWAPCFLELLKKLVKLFKKPQMPQYPQRKPVPKQI